jgi:hypothetical protein
MTPWRWWVGHFEEIECYEGYSNEVASRDEAIAWGKKEWPGQLFYIIEARSSEAMQHEGADIVPFLRTRNKELIEPTIHEIVEHIACELERQSKFLEWQAEGFAPLNFWQRLHARPDVKANREYAASTLRDAAKHVRNLEGLGL